MSVLIYGSFIPTGGRIVSGSWNFRDNYINGSDPDDVATIQVNLEGCYRIAAGMPTMHAYSWDGDNHDSLLWLSNGGTGNGTPIFGLNDKTQSWELWTDHGSFSATYEPLNTGCRYHEIGGEFQFEHNQDGGNGWSASAGWGFFEVSYASPGAKLRKSSGPLYY